MLIAGVGIPGCGKSTIMRLLAKGLKAKCFLEPEEDQWSEAIRRREVIGYFNSIHAFRLLRVPDLYAASELSESGNTVIVDTFYDKLCVHWLGRPGTEWLIKPDDPYFPNFYQTAWLDYKYLPDADVVVVFTVDEASWRRMLEKRSRKLDADSRIAEMFGMQSYFAEAARCYVGDRQGRTQLFEFANRWGDSRTEAARLRLLLCENGVVM
jgi:adenylate kinase